MSDLSKGYTFSGTSPNNNVTAEKLNALVDGATIETGFYSERAEALSGADGDLLLLLQASDGTYRKIRKANLISSGVAKTGFRNLLMSNHAAAPDSQLEASASEVVLRSSAGNVRYVSGFSRTLDATVYAGAATADGRDFAVLVMDAWSYVHAISDGSNDRLLLSLSASSPTLPAGFAYAALLGAVRLDHAGHFTRFVQRECEVALAPASKAGVLNAESNPQTGATPAEFTEVSCDSLGVLQSADLSRCVPPGLVARVRGIIGQSVEAGGSDYCYALAARGSGGLSGASTPVEALGLQVLPTYQVATAVKMFGFYSAASFDLPLAVSQTLYWTASAGAARHNLRITGFTLAL